MKLHSTTIARVRALQHDALEQLARENPPASRPRCLSCLRAGPTIDGYCVPHMPLLTETALHTVAADDVLCNTTDIEL